MFHFFLVRDIRVSFFLYKKMKSGFLKSGFKSVDGDLSSEQCCHESHENRAKEQIGSYRGCCIVLLEINVFGR